MLRCTTSTPMASLSSFHSVSHFKFPLSPFTKRVVASVKCSSLPSPEPEPERTSSLSFSAYKWCTGLGVLGFLETGYLTYVKLSNGDAFCPVGGGGCGDVLNSDYAIVFGVPLPLIGMIAYGLVALLGFQLSTKDVPLGSAVINSRLVLLGVITSMAAASSYFMYLLATKLAGASCLYCVTSVILSFTLFFIALKDFDLQEIQKFAGLQLFVVVLVIGALNTSYSSLKPDMIGLPDVELQPFEPEVTTESSSLAISLANYLHSIGAKMYGAFWCSHCFEQKEMFGKEASKIVDYVECFPEGYRKGMQVAKVCKDAGIDGFPTWIIKDQVLSGEQDLTELARVSGFVLVDSAPK
ncbi:thiol-disulfide oxidoreductase LTO1 [Amborella trichopoda]|nr:thiol-disulfide oxidoreductase LTO1 [Amborella trichopoda]|eukprot:XP_006828878.2 thiol-disulfide oxidoreductase LTO1 [Amborella trichopoda]